jgi:prepilin-type N-terminal cleavage/methylation domain-containing protein
MKKPRGLTIIELLTSIAIIGVLVALLLPAVQSSREAARRATCQNNIRQITLGLLEHESAKKYLPSGGWGFNWIGDPDRGTGYAQPGGWFYNILPYIERPDLAQIGSGLEAGRPTNSSPKCTAMGQLMISPVSIYYCPSRRVARAYARSDGAYNCTSTRVSARIDYAGNGGDNNIIDSTQAFQPRYYSQGDDPQYWDTS